MNVVANKMSVTEVKPWERASLHVGMGPHFEDVFVVAAGRNEVRAALEVFGLLAKSSEYISDLLRVLRKIGQERLGVTV